MADCIFCKIIKGAIPCFKLYESERVFAFLDIEPLAQGHAVCPSASTDLVSNASHAATDTNGLCTQLVIPKHHGAKLTDIPDDQLGELMPVAKKLAKAMGGEDYNILQNNGRLAHQIVDHVHFHVIPKPDQEQGLGITWPAKKADMEKLKEYFNDVKSKI